MDVDFTTVKALSSSTRVEILNYCLNGEETPTSLSRKTDRSKSTVSSHLEKLVEAGLLEKDSEEGRKRVVYQPTGKTEAIAKGRKIKMSLSLAASLAGIGIGSVTVSRILRQTGGTAGDSNMMMEAEATADTAMGSSSSTGSLELLLVAALLTFGFSGIMLAVTWLHYRIRYSGTEKSKDS